MTENLILIYIKLNTEKEWNTWKGGEKREKREKWINECVKHTKNGVLASKGFVMSRIVLIIFVPEEHWAVGFSTEPSTDLKGTVSNAANSECKRMATS